MKFDLLKKRVPFQWRVYNYLPGESKAECVPYIQRKDVLEILNPYSWQNEFYTLNGIIYCKLEVFNDQVWISRSSSGEGVKGKVEETDAFKRAARMFGVGEFLDEIGIYVVNTRGNHVVGHPDPIPIDGDSEPILDLTAFINDQIANKERMEFESMQVFWKEASSFSVLNMVKTKNMLLPEEIASLEVLDSPHEYSDIEAVVEPIRQRLLKGKV